MSTAVVVVRPERILGGEPGTRVLLPVAVPTGGGFVGRVTSLGRTIGG